MPADLVVRELQHHAVGAFDALLVLDSAEHEMLVRLPSCREYHPLHASSATTTKVTARLQRGWRQSSSQGVPEAGTGFMVRPSRYEVEHAQLGHLACCGGSLQLAAALPVLTSIMGKGRGPSARSVVLHAARGTRHCVIGTQCKFSERIWGARVGI
jgi:hypothetical protein